LDTKYYYYRPPRCPNVNKLNQYASCSKYHYVIRL
jgi:hypothetical protein